MSLTIVMRDSCSPAMPSMRRAARRCAANAAVLVEWKLSNNDSATVVKKMLDGTLSLFATVLACWTRTVWYMCRAWTTRPMLPEATPHAAVAAAWMARSREGPLSRWGRHWAQMSHGRVRLDGVRGVIVSNNVST